MKDHEIVDLYWARDERAISETQETYGAYCGSIAYRIVNDFEDTKECLNDMYLAAWNSMPTHRPERLGTFLGKITRRIALKKMRTRTAQKRGGAEVMLTLDELAECIPGNNTAEELVEQKELTAILNAFLEELPAVERQVFLCRYWYFDSIADISARFGFGQSKVKMMLKRTRDKLLARLAM